MNGEEKDLKPVVPDEHVSDDENAPQIAKHRSVKRKGHAPTHDEVMEEIEPKEVRPVGKTAVRKIVAPEDVFLIIYLVKRFVGTNNKDINKFLQRIDEPQELDKLYNALQVFVDFIEGK